MKGRSLFRWFFKQPTELVAQSASALSLWSSGKASVAKLLRAELTAAFRNVRQTMPYPPCTGDQLEAAFAEALEKFPPTAKHNEVTFLVPILDVSLTEKIKMVDDLKVVGETDRMLHFFPDHFYRASMQEPEAHGRNKIVQITLRPKLLNGEQNNLFVEDVLSLAAFHMTVCEQILSIRSPGQIPQPFLPKWIGFGSILPAGFKFRGRSPVRAAEDRLYAIGHNNGGAESGWGVRWFPEHVLYRAKSDAVPWVGTSETVATF